MSDVVVPKIGVILGSFRTHGNCRGISHWFTQQLSAIAQRRYEIIQIFPTESLPVVGPVIDDTMPALIKEYNYNQIHIKKWSETVRNVCGIIIITPQYNWGIPGELKNAFDHLYHEWTNKPVICITYGGHGGSKVNIALRTCLEGLHMKIVKAEVAITLPKEYIAGDTRVKSSGGTDTAAAADGSHDTFLKAFEEQAATASREFIDILDEKAKTADKTV